jgi:tetratricopeptide (TPR) repeat protein
VLSEQERFEAAIVHFDRLLAVRPDLADVWLARGLALQRTNRQQEAIASCGRALARGGETGSLAWAQSPALLRDRSWQRLLISGPINMIRTFSAH